MTLLDERSARRKTRTDVAVPIKVRLAALWTATMFLFAYADIQHFVLQPGSLEDLQQGTLAGITINQEFLFGAAVLMTVPALMIVASVTLRATVSRVLNIVVGAAFALISIGAIVLPSEGEVWWYYRFYSLVEVILTGTVVVLAWAWPRTGGTPS